MTTRFPFEYLSPANQKRAAVRFFDAQADDGYLYELNTDGAVLCRSRAPRPFPVWRDGRVCYSAAWRGAFRRGYLAFIAGETLADCPYADKRNESGRLTWSRAFQTAWTDGWRYARTVAHV